MNVELLRFFYAFFINFVNEPVSGLCVRLVKYEGDSLFACTVAVDAASLQDITELTEKWSALNSDLGAFDEVFTGQEEQVRETGGAHICFVRCVAVYYS